jgi:hypothetical protein
MKKLKTLFLFLALVCAVNSFGQTKEETLDWLNMNAKDLIDCNFLYPSGKYKVWFIIQSFTMDSFTYKSGSSDASFNIEDNSSLFRVAYKDIVLQDVSKLSKTDGNVPKIIVKTKLNAIMKLDSNNNPTKFSEDIYIVFENEENAKRVIKAIMHLGKLSGAKENKQTF